MCVERSGAEVSKAPQKINTLNRGSTPSEISSEGVGGWGRNSYMHKARAKTATCRSVDACCRLRGMWHVRLLSIPPPAKALCLISVSNHFHFVHIIRDTYDDNAVPPTQPMWVNQMIITMAMMHMIHFAECVLDGSGAEVSKAPQKIDTHLIGLDTLRAGRTVAR